MPKKAILNQCARCKKPIEGEGHPQAIFISTVGLRPAFADKIEVMHYTYGDKILLHPACAEPLLAQFKEPSA